MALALVACGQQQQQQPPAPPPPVVTAITVQAGTVPNIIELPGRIEAIRTAEVRALGIQVTEGTAGFLEVITLSSKSGKTTPVELGNFAENNIRNELRRIDGVGDVQLFGSPYAMRIWLDPQKLAGYSLSASEALAAVQEQNSQTAGGCAARSVRSR